MDAFKDIGIYGNTLETGLSGHILGPELRRLRDERHIKATGLIAMGYSNPLISQIEKGQKRKVSLEFIYEYSKIINWEFIALLKHLVQHQYEVLKDSIENRGDLISDSVEKIRKQSF